MYLKDRTKAHIERVVGKPFSQISNMELEEEIRYVEKKTKKPLVYSSQTDHRMTGRGNPLIVTRRLCTKTDAEKRFKKLK